MANEKNGESKKVLFIEDERRLHDMIVPVLKKGGYEVFSAFDGELGVNMLEEQKPDLVLLDIILPKKDGFEVLEYLHSKEEYKNTPVIILTNLEEKYDIERAMSFGVRAYLIKANYRPEEILNKVSDILGNTLNI